MQVLSTVLHLGTQNACHIMTYHQETIKIVTSKMICEIARRFF